MFGVFYPRTPFFLPLFRVATLRGPSRTWQAKLEHQIVWIANKTIAVFKSDLVLLELLELLDSRAIAVCERIHD